MQRNNKNSNSNHPASNTTGTEWLSKLDALLSRNQGKEDGKAYMTEEEMDAWIKEHVKPEDEEDCKTTAAETEQNIDEMSRRLTARLSSELGFNLDGDEEKIGPGQTDDDPDENKKHPGRNVEIPDRNIPELDPEENEPVETVPRIAAATPVDCGIENRERQTGIFMQVVKWAGGIAAAVILGLTGFHYLEEYKAMTHRMASAGMTTSCEGDSTFSLSDGTEIMLQGGSHLSAYKDFGKDTRHVRIDGQGFMHAATDSLRPYIVDMPHDVSLEVKGTAFNINAYSGNPVCEITVSSGCVEIKKSSTGISYGLFRKGDRFTYNSETGEVIRGKADLGKLMAWKDKNFSLNRATLSDFREEVFRVYGKTVYIEDNALKPGVAIECRMQYVAHPSLETVLTQVCASQQADYRIDGSSVFIYPANNI